MTWKKIAESDEKFDDLIWWPTRCPQCRNDLLGTTIPHMTLPHVPAIELSCPECSSPGSSKPFSVSVYYDINRSHIYRFDNLDDETRKELHLWIRRNNSPINKWMRFVNQTLGN